MRQLSLLLIIVLNTMPGTAQDAPIRLLVRADDMGASRSANVAAIEAYEKGIVRSVEVMVPGAWFEDAVMLLNDRPDLDVGIHLTLTSEWDKVKWRPLTQCPSITGEDGYFFPFVWKSDRIPSAANIVESAWDIREIEQELRAQIELGIKRIPHITHLSEHMGCLSFSDATKELLQKLAAEYGLAVDLAGVSRFPSWSGSAVPASEKIGKLRRQLQQLSAGTYLLVEHPALDDLETRGLGHVGYENVAEDRAGVFRAFIDDDVQRIVAQRGIELISYRELKSAVPSSVAQTNSIARAANVAQPPAHPEVRWVNPEIPQIAGLNHYILSSNAMGHAVGYTVWTPKEYHEQTAKRYPVIYFLHGMGGSESSDAAGFSSWLAKAIESQVLPPVICVFPNGGRSGYRGEMEQMMVAELIPHIDREYRTISRAEARGVVGFSMGGVGAVRLAIMYPELFSAAGSMGGGIRLERDELERAVARALPSWKHRGFGFFLVNGDQDRPQAFSAFAKKLSNAGVDHHLLVLEDTAHNLGHYYERSVNQLLFFVGRHLEF
ncbi:MAG TPA: ChbG/HpnK family deacetylase [Parapedobacter sp.]|uniref:ChbG/HpnK family deacetylase n=1 Tax=Parapedobacter sp. TaxID=1958893 RepID=UPI002C497F81|nr:ChbG/HpnK family deacetylase [Parapedobacter sp.]HWK57788.1 ChbG/HpnK family deacetylase [Parapedobacter sp.]